MNRAITWLTVRQLLGKRRTLLMAVFACVPALLALIFRASGDTEPGEWTANTLLSTLVIGTLLPLAALVFGTAALGSEIDDGTAVYLLSKPIARWRIVLSKLAVAWAVTALFVVLSGVIAAAISVQDGYHGFAMIAAFAVAMAAGALVYCCIFIMASVVTTRAFVAGLIYVFLWEGLITGLFEGTRVLSVRQYTRGLARALTDVPEEVFEANLGGAAAIVGMVAVGTLATWYAVRRLERFEIGES
jgi:ABC-2 type transport system permease protein